MADVRASGFGETAGDMIPGAGVVADSTPQGEYEETINKAMGVIRAIERARTVVPS